MKHYSWHIAGKYQFTKKTETPREVRVKSILSKISEINSEREKKDECGYFEYKPALAEKLKTII
jgi:hypothetical protein